MLGENPKPLRYLSLLVPPAQPLQPWGLSFSLQLTSLPSSISQGLSKVVSP